MQTQIEKAAKSLPRLPEHTSSKSSKKRLLLQLKNTPDFFRLVFIPKSKVAVAGFSKVENRYLFRGSLFQVN